MKPGWKNRIDERRYFEEMRERQRELSKLNTARRTQEAIRMIQYEIEEKRARNAGPHSWMSRFV